MADKLRVGIIGANVAGWAGRAHMPALAAGIPGVELVAVSTTRQESADEAAAKFGATQTFTDHREMLEKADIDVAAVVVRLPLHHELATDVIRAGKHVFVEWPLGTTTAQAEEIADLADKHGVRTAIGLQSRFTAQYLHMRALIADGYVGEVLACNLTQFGSGALGRPASRMWMRDKAAAANTLHITFAHAIDRLLTPLGPIDSLSSVVSTQTKEWIETESGDRFPVDAPDNVLISGRMKNGAVVSIHVAQNAGLPTGHRLEVHGSKGTLVVEGPGLAQSGGAWMRGATEGEKELHHIDVPQEDWVPAAELRGSPVDVGKLWKRFAESVRNGETGFSPDFHDAVVHHKLVDAIQRASDTGHVQQVG